jgi:dienelactone hydrolase
MTTRSVNLMISLTAFFGISAAAAEPNPLDTSRGDAMIADYFREETAQLTADCLAEVQTREDWETQKPKYRRQLFEMLGLDPLPERTPLNETITGTVEHEEFFVEKLHFQSSPGLYVTGNLYRPKIVSGKLPAILYVCGHGRVKKDGISYGNKATYQHHGGWFARNGYICLIIDTLQLGEIEGIHHGTYNHNMWWWNSRGYTSAGVEAWNCIRALDYLQSREEVDPERIGVTGRSGGGAYSWWIAALDERIKVAVPVAGITSLHNHVVDGTVEGHCDCMFMVNTYRWDFPLVAALVAPRPLLISNSDKDRIFPLEGVIDVYSKTRRIYDLYGARDRLGLQITEGPHKDTQELRIHAFHWMNRFLKDEDPLIDQTAVKFFEPEQLKVFDELPADELNTTIQESFTLSAEPKVPESGTDWAISANAWKTQLMEKSFRGWPQTAPDLDLEPAFTAERDGIRFSAWNFTSQNSIRLRLYLAYRSDLKPDELDLIVLNVLDEQGWQDFLATMRPGFEQKLTDETLPEGSSERYEEQKKMFQNFKWGMAYLAPRGIGPTAWDQSERKQTQHRRRFQLLGQTLDGMRVWDIVRGCAALRQVEHLKSIPLWLQAERNMACNTLYASLFAPEIKRVDLWHLPPSHQAGPDYLNVLRVLDIPQAVAMAAERSQVRIYQNEDADWPFPLQTVEQLGWDSKQLQIRKIPAEDRK